MAYTISIQQQESQKLSEHKSAPFGVLPTDHMFLSEYNDGKWNNPRIIPFASINMSPLTLCLHYGQTVFEGMKAFYMKDGSINIFRPEKHYERFNKSLHRMCMPEVPKDLFMDALHQFVQLEKDWIPNDEDGSLYLRPFMIASEERLGVKVSDEYIFFIVATPVHQYYSKPLKIKVETKYTRAADGGTGFAKCGGNYGASFYPSQLAKEKGFDQVVWTDSKHHEFIEESGTMNLMFFIDGTLVTPALSGTILDGVTRDSLLTLAHDLKFNIQVRPISINELKEALKAGKKVEAFGAGTAAVVAPVEIISIFDKEYACYTGDDAQMYQLKHALYRSRKGIDQDIHHWNYML
jgi:branched-chain amino acid aminotransferase